MFEKIHRWYEGEYKPPKDHGPLVMLMGHYERHWTARLTTWLIVFWLREYKWIIGTIIAIVAVAYKVMS